MHTLLLYFDAGSGLTPARPQDEAWGYCHLFQCFVEPLGVPVRSGLGKGFIPKLPLIRLFDYGGHPLVHLMLHIETLTTEQQ